MFDGLSGPCCTSLRSPARRAITDHESYWRNELQGPKSEHSICVVVVWGRGQEHITVCSAVQQQQRFRVSTPVRYSHSSTGHCASRGDPHNLDPVVIQGHCASRGDPRKPCYRAGQRSRASRGDPRHSDTVATQRDCASRGEETRKPKFMKREFQSFEISK